MRHPCSDLGLSRSPPADSKHPHLSRQARNSRVVQHRDLTHCKCGIEIEVYNPELILGPRHLLLHKRPHQLHRSISPTRNSSSSTGYIWQPDYKQTEMGRRPNGRTSMTMRMTGRRTRLNGTTVPRLVLRRAILLPLLLRNKPLPKHSRRSKRRRPRPKPPSQSPLERLALTLLS